VLDLQEGREASPAKDAATVVLVRAVGGAAGTGGIEVFCVVRSRESGFMGGAVVFPGGKLDPSDVLAEWTPLTTPPRSPDRDGEPFTHGDAHFRSLAIAAARETLEEAAILHVDGGAVTDEELLVLRKELEGTPDALRAFLSRRQLRLDLGALHPFARWITPVAESRRFDARFFMAVAPEGQTGAHDERETTSSTWASPEALLERFERGEIQLMPPTHRTLALLVGCRSTDDALAIAARASLSPICPRLAKHPSPEGEQDGAETLALVLPGDPAHDVREARVPGKSRYVLRGERWLPEDPPT